MKHFTKIADISKAEVIEILNLAKKLQMQKERAGCLPPLLKGKNMVMIFEKPSLRTHLAFQIAMADLGGNSVYFGQSNIFVDADKEERESLYDIVKNLELFADAIVARVFKHESIVQMAKISQIPVINALCNLHHPTQVLGDLYTIREHFKTLKNLKLAWVGDGNNVATSLAQICSLMGLAFTIATPKGFEIPKKEVAHLKGFFASYDPIKAVTNADVVLTDTWISMGMEKEKVKRRAIFQKYQVNKALMKKAKKTAIFMHCLPAHRGFEVTDEVMDSKQSVVFAEAVARTYIVRALLVKLLGKN